MAVVSIRNTQKIHYQKIQIQYCIMFFPFPVFIQKLLKRSGHLRKLGNNTLGRCILKKGPVFHFVGNLTQAVK